MMKVLIWNFWDRVRIYIGTEEIMARVVPLGAEELAAGVMGLLNFV